jgi:hypothetical protein
MKKSFLPTYIVNELWRTSANKYGHPDHPNRCSVAFCSELELSQKTGDRATTPSLVVGPSPMSHFVGRSLSRNTPQNSFHSG